jgi:hypothetical protein
MHHSGHRISIAVVCCLAALVASDGFAFAQAGSAGGTLGKTDKSASGGEDHEGASRHGREAPRRSTSVGEPHGASAKAYSKIGNFSCSGGAEYPDTWREGAPFCVSYGCNFGKMSQDACLTLGAKKQSKTVIHGIPGTTRANECWLQHSCADLRQDGEFLLFKMN